MDSGFAICFDLDNTLFDRQAVHRLFCRSLIGDDFHLLERCMTKDGRGHTDRMTYFSWLAEVVATGESGDQLWTRYRREIVNHIAPGRDVSAMLAWLRRTTRLCLVTNGSHDLQMRKLRRLGLEECFDIILISESLGFAKPDRRVFEEVCKRLNCEPSRVCFVGDDPDRDIEPAIRHGMSAVHVTETDPPSTRVSSPRLRVVGSVLECEHIIPQMFGQPGTERS